MEATQAWLPESQIRATPFADRSSFLPWQAAVRRTQSLAGQPVADMRATNYEGNTMTGGTSYRTTLVPASGWPAAGAPAATSTVAASGGGLGALLIGGLVLGAAAAAGAAGGGDSDGGDTFAPGPDSGSEPPPPLGNYDTTEYQRNYSLGMINAATRYADGGTGQGVLLSVYDSGADVDHVDLLPNVRSDLSYSYFTGTGDVRDFVGHGTHVASIVAGARNGIGMHGVAYDADLMILQGLDRGDGSIQRTDVLTAWGDGQHRSVTAGARAINHSWGLADPDGNEAFIEEYTRDSLRTYLGDAMLSRLAESDAAGLVTVFAAGNNAHSQAGVAAGIPYHYPEFEDHWLAVTAVTSTGAIADYSNRCGIAMNFCLSAPGDRIYGAASSDAGGPQDGIILKAGTSPAAPHVTGAIGVLAENFPELTGAQIRNILLDTARDAGAAGIDAVYGRGILDLENAVAPQGALMVQTGTTLYDGATALDGSHIVGTGSVASALRASLAGSGVMITDGYDRGYQADLGGFVATSSGMTAKMASLTAFTSGESGLDWASGASFGSDYASLVDGLPSAQTAVIGATEITVEGAFDDHDSYTAAGLTTRFGTHSLSVGLGRVAEHGQMLGAAITGGFGDGLETETRFARVGADLALSDATSVQVSAAYGVSDFSSDGILARGRDIASSSLAIGLTQQGVFARRDSFSVGLARPLSIDGGKMSLDAPVAMAAASGGERGTDVFRATRDIEMAGSAFAADLQIGYSTEAGPGRLALGSIWSPADTGRADLGFSVGYTISF